MRIEKKVKSAQFDVVVVGSGPAGVNAAYPLVEAGLKVAIIDGGLNSKKQEKELTFLKRNFSKTSNSYDLLQNSSHVFNKTYQLLKIKSNIEIIQSLARGGLSEVWHGICDFLSPTELERIGLPVNEIQREYQEVGKRIKLKSRLPLDLHSRLILQSARNKDNSKSTVYKLPSAASYNSRSCIGDLKRFKNFTYIPNQLVYKVENNPLFVEIKSTSIDKLLEFATRTHFLILAAGSINTTRILLRSLGLFNYQTTFLTKAHYSIVCLHLRTFLKKINFKKLSIGQIAISSKETNQGLSAFFIQIYRFNPLALQKALKYIPLPKVVTLKLLSTIAPSLVIADVRFPAFESKNKFCKLNKEDNGKDVLRISFQENNKELESHKKQLGKIMQQLRSLGLFPLKTVGDYATAHYAGGVPFTAVPGKLSTDTNGKLHQASRIYVADSSTWRSLAAKPPTLTIIANASRVGKNVLRKFH